MGNHHLIDRVFIAYLIHCMSKETGRVVGPQTPQGGLTLATLSKNFNP
jgi:hypothetical protein